MHPWSSFRLFTDSAFKLHLGLWPYLTDRPLNKMQAFVWIHYSLRPLWTRWLLRARVEQKQSVELDSEKLNFGLHPTKGKNWKWFVTLAKKLRSDCNDRKLDSRGLYFFFLVWLPLNLSQIVYVYTFRQFILGSSNWLCKHEYTLGTHIREQMFVE